jgi:hypothetical protein
MRDPLAGYIRTTMVLEAMRKCANALVLNSRYADLMEASVFTGTPEELAAHQAKAREIAAKAAHLLTELEQMGAMTNGQVFSIVRRGDGWEVR